MTMYVAQPRLCREVSRVFDFKPLDGSPQAGFYVSRVTVEIPFGAACLAEDKKKVVTKTKPGDLLLLTPAIEGKVHQRIIDVECHQLLYKFGAPIFRRKYAPTDALFQPLTWQCFESMDLSKLPYLYEVYIIDEVVK